MIRFIVLSRFFKFLGDNFWTTLGGSSPLTAIGGIFGWLLFFSLSSYFSKFINSFWLFFLGWFFAFSCAYFLTLPATYKLIIDKAKMLRILAELKRDLSNKRFK